MNHVQVQMHGGKASQDINGSTTHVVVLPSSAVSSTEAAAEGTAVRPSNLLRQLLTEHGGLPALKTLHRRLQAQQAHVVSQR
jgi:hypothetical protein